MAPSIAVERRGGIGGVELAAGDRPLERARDPVTARGDERVVALDERDREPGAGGDLDDPRSHEPAPDDPDVPDVLRFHGLPGLPRRREPVR